VGAPPEAGLSDREITKRAGSLEDQLAIMPAALARGDITIVREELDELLNAFQLNVDRKSQSYRKAGCGGAGSSRSGTQGYRESKCRRAS